MAEQDGWDVWVITSHRSSDTLKRFLAGFVDLAAAEDRGDEQLMLRPIDRSTTDFALSPSTAPGEVARWFRESFDWEPALTLTHSIQRGLSRPWRAFSLFDLPCSRPDLMAASIGFTPDGDLVLGLTAKTREDAVAWLTRLAEEFDADLGLVSGQAVQSRDRAEELIATNIAQHHWRRPRGTRA